MGRLVQKANTHGLLRLTAPATRRTGKLAEIGVLFDARHMQAMKTIRTEARKRGITSARTVIASRGFFTRIASLWPSFLAIVVLIALLMRRRLDAAVISPLRPGRWYLIKMRYRIPNQSEATAC